MASFGDLHLSAHTEASLPQWAIELLHWSYFKGPRLLLADSQAWLEPAQRAIVILLRPMSATLPLRFKGTRKASRAVADDVPSCLSPDEAIVSLRRGMGRPPRESGWCVIICAGTRQGAQTIQTTRASLGL